MFAQSSSGACAPPRKTRATIVRGCSDTVPLVPRIGTASHDQAGTNERRRSRPSVASADRSLGERWLPSHAGRRMGQLPTASGVAASSPNPAGPTRTTFADSQGRSKRTSHNDHPTPELRVREQHPPPSGAVPESAELVLRQTCRSKLQQIRITPEWTDTSTAARTRPRQFPDGQHRLMSGSDTVMQVRITP